MNPERGLVWSLGWPQDGAGGHLCHSLDGTTDLSDVGRGRGGAVAYAPWSEGRGGRGLTGDRSRLNVPTC